MPTELIFTSAPEGIKPGSSGYCTVARHEEMDPFLERALEGISFYEMDGALRPFIHAFRILRLQTGNFYVLSRICYAGSDHTGRFNYLAHHLAFSESEIFAESLPSPADYLLESDRWLDQWPSGKRPTLFSQGEGATPLFLDKPLPVQGNDWERITGDARNAAEFFYRRDWRILTASGDHYVPLSLLSESCASAAVDVSWKWQTLTFTTFLQPSDSPENFFVTCGNSGSAVEKLNRDTLYLDKDSESCFQAVSASAPTRLVPTQPEQQETTPPEEASPEVLSEQATAPQAVSKPVQSGVSTPAQVANEPTGAKEYSQPEYDIAPPDPVLSSEWTKRKILTISGASLAGVIILVVSLVFLFSDDDSKEVPSPNQASVEDQAPDKNGADAVVQDGGETQPVSPETNQSKPAAIAGSTPRDSQSTKNPSLDSSPSSPVDKPSLPKSIDLQSVAGQEQIPTEFHFVDKLKPFEKEGFKITHAFEYEPDNMKWDWQDGNGSVDTLAYRLEKGEAKSDSFDSSKLPEKIRYVFIKGSFPEVRISGFHRKVLTFIPDLAESDSMQAYEKAKTAFLNSIEKIKVININTYNTILEKGGLANQEKLQNLGIIKDFISRPETPSDRDRFIENYFPSAKKDLDKKIADLNLLLNKKKEEKKEIESIKKAREELAKIPTLKDAIELGNGKEVTPHTFYESAVRRIAKQSGFVKADVIRVSGESHDIKNCMQSAAEKDFKEGGRLYQKGTPLFDATQSVRKDIKDKYPKKESREIIKICRDDLSKRVNELNTQLREIIKNTTIKDLNDAFDKPKAKKEEDTIDSKIKNQENLIESLKNIITNIDLLENTLNAFKEPTEVREGERVLLRIVKGAE